MKKIKLLFCLIFLYTITYGNEIDFGAINSDTEFIKNIVSQPVSSNSFIDESKYMFLYDSFGLSDKINYRIFKMAVKGYSKIEKKKNHYLVIVDYSKPSNEKDFLY